MKKIRLKVSIGLIIAGFLGLVLFFPFKYENGQTCIWERWLNQHSYHGRPISFEACLHRYVLPYGLVWWSSIGLIIVELHILKRNSKTRFQSNLKEDESPI